MSRFTWQDSLRDYPASSASKILRPSFDSSVIVAKGTAAGPDPKIPPTTLFKPRRSPVITRQLPDLPADRVELPTAVARGHFPFEVWTAHFPSAEEYLNSWIKELVQNVCLTYYPTHLSSYKRLVLSVLIRLDNRLIHEDLIDPLLQLPIEIDPLLDLVLIGMLAGIPLPLNGESSKKVNYLSVQLLPKEDALFAQGAIGIYDRGHNIYVQEDLNPPAAQMAVICHEWVHAITLWVYQNECLPYSRGDEERARIWQDLSNQVNRDNQRFFRDESMEASLYQRIISPRELIAYALESRLKGHASIPLLKYDKAQAGLPQFYKDLREVLNRRRGLEKLMILPSRYVTPMEALFRRQEQLEPVHFVRDFPLDQLMKGRLSIAGSKRDKRAKPISVTDLPQAALGIFSSGPRLAPVPQSRVEEKQATLPPIASIRSQRGRR